MAAQAQLGQEVIAVALTVGVAELPERIGYQRAMDAGFAATETTHRSLNEKAEAVAQDIADRLAGLVMDREVA